MARTNKKWTDDQVEAEISRLLESEAVRLARKEKQIKYRRKQYMWSLQLMETRGKQLMDQGVSFDNIEEMLFGVPEDTYCE